MNLPSGVFYPIASNGGDLDCSCYASACLNLLNKIFEYILY